MGNRIGYRLCLGVVSLGLLCAAVGATEPKIELLWPDGAPAAKGDAEGDKPTLTICLPDQDKATGAAVVICPGGGYDHLATDREGYQVAQRFNSFGIAGIVLTYRHRGSGAGYGYPAPQQDAQRAIRTVRSRAKEWGVDPNRVGILGFSAGGHLASSAATHFSESLYEPRDAIDSVSCRPDFAILVYPVITMKDPFTHKGSRKNLLGADPDEQLVEKMSNETQVTPQTPPTFLLHGWDDTTVPVENSIRFCLALRQAGVSAEVHIFRNAPHGFNLARNRGPVSVWPDLCRQWMQVSGFLDKEPAKMP